MSHRDQAVMQAERSMRKATRQRGRVSCLVRCLVRALPNSAVLDQGGACGAAGPPVTGAAQCHLSQLRLSSSRPPRLDRSLRSRRRRSALPKLDPAATHQGWALRGRLGRCSPGRRGRTRPRTPGRATVVPPPGCQERERRTRDDSQRFHRSDRHRPSRYRPSRSDRPACHLGRENNARRRSRRRPRSHACRWYQTSL